jgi:hypothetical protein
MGWLPLDPMHLKPRSLAEAGFLYHTYANKRGQAYVESMERFTQSTSHMESRVAEEGSRLTLGAHTVVKAVRQEMDKLKEKNDKPSALPDQKVVHMEKGQVNVSSRLHQIIFQAQKILDESQLELIRRDGVDINTVLQPVSELDDPSFSSALAQTEVSELLIGNTKDMESINKIESVEMKKEQLERIRRRLMCLAAKAPQAAFFPIKDPPVVSGTPVRPPSGVPFRPHPKGPTPASLPVFRPLGPTSQGPGAPKK